MKTTTIVMLLAALYATGWWGRGQMVQRQDLELQVIQCNEMNNNLLVEVNSLADTMEKCLEIKQENELKNDEIEFLQQYIKECDQLRVEIRKRDETVEKKDAELASKNRTIRSLEKAVEKNKSDQVRKMTLTAYTLSHDECGPDLTPALPNSEAVVGETAAVSPDLSHWLGKHVYIEGFGVRYINDLTSKKFSNRVDILVASKTEAYEIGCQNGVVVKPVI